MKHISRVLIALLLAVLIAMTLPAQVFAEGTDEKYISEVQIGVGKNASEAEKSLDGYEILKDDKGNYVDLNKNAGATGIGGKGNRVVYMGFKRTANDKQAITDLAVMNMKGGYKVEDYEALMEQQMSSQILPFVENFLSTLAEYRENYKSKNPANKQRADYIHDTLNKMTDDDCGGAPLGDLLLNETKYEMGDAAYNALSAEQKKEHADIVTIIAQANGKATLIMENLLVRAADTNENSWLDRFVSLSYDNLIDETGAAPSKAAKLVAREYDDTAQTLLAMWKLLSESLNSADSDEAELEKLSNKDFDVESKLADYEKNSTDEKFKAAATAVYNEAENSVEIIEKAGNVALRDYLKTVEYDGGTLYDFFTKTYEDVESDITVLYPLAAALSDGQRACLEFLSLKDLILIGGTGEEAYKSSMFDELEEGSIYNGVDRGIYEKGGVALTSDALRADALAKMVEDSDFFLSWYNIVLMGVAGACAVGFISTLVYNRIVNVSKVNYYNKLINTTLNVNGQTPEYVAHVNRVSKSYALKNPGLTENEVTSNVKTLIDTEKEQAENLVKHYSARSATCRWLGAGIGIAMIIIIGITVYLTYQDMVNRYKVDFTPIPRYIVDEKDITGYNIKGEKIVLKNQSAYYKAVICNRTGGDYYDSVGNIGDLNGYVGKQWLALYTARNDAETPILADSFKFANSEEIPAGYETGIHSFGSDAAENLNNTLYVWNSTAPKVYVYFKTEKAPASTTGSSFTAGNVALSGAAGLAVGALATALGATISKKKKGSKPAEA